MRLELNGRNETNDARLAQRAGRDGRNRRLESIKMQRRRVRREKWLPGMKALANGLGPSAGAGN